MTLLSLLILVLGLAVQGSRASEAGVDWLLSGDDWTGYCASGNAQSPINLDSTACIVEAPYEQYSELIQMIPQGILGVGKGVHLEYSAGGLDVKWDDWSNEAWLENVDASMAEAAQQFIGQPLNVHFHIGSEHTLNGRPFVMEAHIVRQLNTTGCGSEKCLAVFGLFFAFPPVDGYANDTFPPLANMLAAIRQKSDGVVKLEEDVTATDLHSTWETSAKEPPEGEIPLTDELDFANLFPESLNYFAYNGSLTTPPCTQNVNWTVFEEPLMINVPDFTLMNTINAYLLHQRTNDRMIQPLNERPVYCPMGKSED